jgi:hypothetical protein
VNIAILACLVVIVICSIAGLAGFDTSRWQSRAHERERQSWAAERRALLDRIMVLAGHGEYVPPIEYPEREEEIPDLILDPGEMPFAEMTP